MRSDARRRRLRSGAAAFTLLETLAAVAVLALVYVTLARVGIAGLREEGESDRRLRAALLADARVADLEAQALSGQSLTPGDTDEPAGEFTLSVAIEPFELTLPAPPEAAAKRLRDVKGAADAAKAVAGDAPKASLFAPVAPGQPAPGRRIRVRVVWDEGATEESVLRETYALDLAAAAPLLEALQSAAEAQAESKAGATETDAATPNVPQAGGAAGNGPPGDRDEP